MTGLRRLIILISFFFVAAGAGGHIATAGSIYVEGSSGVLGTLDPLTGVVTEIGSSGRNPYGLAFDASGNLYELGSDANLYAVDKSTAALSLIGPYTGNFNGGAALGNASDGTLYAINGQGDIWTVSASTGAATVLGNMGVVPNSISSGDGGSGPYVTSGSSLYAINRTSGAATLIGTGTYGEVFGLAFTNNTMYAIDAPSQGTGVYALDLTNGHSTLVSNYDASVVGSIDCAAAFGAASVPEPSSVILLGLGALGLVSLYGRFRPSDEKGVARS